MEKTPGLREASYLRWLVATLTVGLASCLALVLAIDPSGRFGTGLVPPLVLTSRRQRLDGLASPEGRRTRLLVLGSSRAMPWDPQVAEELTGLPSYNAGVSLARSEDLLGLFRYATEVLHLPLEHVLLGIEPEMFRPDLGPHPRLMVLPRLRALAGVAPPWTWQLQRLGEALTWGELRACWRSLAAPADPTSEGGLYRFGERGRLLVSNWERRAARPGWDRPRYLAAAARRRRNIYAGFPRLDPARLASFAHLLDRVRAARVQGTVVLLDMHPELIADLGPGSGVPERRRELVRFLSRRVGEAGLRLVDLRTTPALALLPDEYVDDIHPDRRAATRQLRALLAPDATPHTARGAASAAPPASSEPGTGSSQ